MHTSNKLESILRHCGIQDLRQISRPIIFARWLRCWNASSFIPFLTKNVNIKIPTMIIFVNLGGRHLILFHTHQSEERSNIKIRKTYSSAVVCLRICYSSCYVSVNVYVSVIVNVYISVTGCWSLHFNAVRNICNIYDSLKKRPGNCNRWLATDVRWYT